MLAAMGDDAPPVLQTLHWDLRKHPGFYGSFEGHGRVAFAAVSQSQLDRAPQRLRAQTLDVVPLAVPQAPALGLPRGRHALMLARITRDKGQDVAARVCRAAGVPLVLAGPVAGIDEPGELRARLSAGDAALASTPTCGSSSTRWARCWTATGCAGSVGWQARPRSGCCSLRWRCWPPTVGPSPGRRVWSRRWPEEFP